MSQDQNLVEAIDHAGSKVARALDFLGLAGAATPMGAIEVLAKEIRDGFGDLSAAVGAGLSEVAGALDRLADAVQCLAPKQGGGEQA